MMFHDRDESVLARESTWRGGDSSASVCQAGQQRMGEQSLTSPLRNVNLDRQSKRGAAKETDREDAERVGLTEGLPEIP